MAIYRPSAIVAAISGKLGGVVFVRNHGSNVVRHRPAGRGGRSPGHDIPAQRLALIQRTWQTLTPQQHSAWRTFTNEHPLPNRLGVRRPLSPYQAFVRFNLRSFQYRGILRLTPIPTHTSLIPTSISVTASASGQILLQFSPQVPAPFYKPLVYASTKSRNSVSSFYNNWRFLNDFADTGENPRPITDFWAAIWPHPVQAQDVAIRADFYSTFFIFQASFTATTITAA